MRTKIRAKNQYFTLSALHERPLQTWIYHDEMHKYQATIQSRQD